MPKNDRSLAHKELIKIMNSPGVSERVQANAVKVVGELEIQYAKLKLARYKAKQTREKEKTTRKGFGIMDD
jgi:hypothetical protein